MSFKDIKMMESYEDGIILVDDDYVYFVSNTNYIRTHKVHFKIKELKRQEGKVFVVGRSESLIFYLERNFFNDCKI